MCTLQSKSLKFLDGYLCLPYSLKDYMLVSLDSIIFLASMTHIAWSTFHELHYMDEDIFEAFLKSESEICKRNFI